MQPSPLPDISEQDFYWLAGLLEGEGSFYFSKGRYPSVAVSMTDLDVVERAARLMGVRALRHQPRPGCKPLWTAYRFGHYAAVLMRNLQPAMGERRSARIGEILADWDSWEHKMPKGSGLRSAPKCHPEKTLFGGGLCGTCYMRQYRLGRRVRAGTFA